MKSRAEITADFDAIAAALASAPPDDRLSPAERVLLGAIPQYARTGLDVGCGHGALSRAAATRGLRMLGVDLSGEMIALARARTPDSHPVTSRVADVMVDELEPNEFDVVLAVNVVHHLPLEAIVPRVAKLVAPGGLLLIQDVLDRSDLLFVPLNGLAAARRLMRRLTGADRSDARVRRLYERHGTGERYFTPGEAVRDCPRLLPGAKVSHHLEWRYSVIWSPNTILRLTSK